MLSLNAFQKQMEKLALDTELVMGIKSFIERGELDNEDKKQNNFILEHFDLLTKNDFESSKYQEAKKKDC